MYINTAIFAVLLAFCELTFTYAKPLVHIPNTPNTFRRRTHLEYVRRAASSLGEDGIRRRDPQSSSATLLTPSSSNAAMNLTIATACINALNLIPNVTNSAGMSACYNIIQYDSSIPAFQADLRLYHSSPPSGPFASISVNSMTIALNYPSSTVFKSLTKRANLQDNSEIQQYSLFGSFVANTDLSSLNTTQLLSLMVPTITINAVDSLQKPVTTNITSDETVYFVTGQFAGNSSAIAVNPGVQASAVAQAKVFVLPGTTFGIFPVGFIVTMAWTFLFLLAYGLGTMGRLRHRRVYRKRIAATLGRTAQRL